MYPTLRLERALWKQAHIVAGVDEVGRGAWAGPLVAAAVILPQDHQFKNLQGLKESKQLAPSVRERFASAIRQCAAWAVGVVDVLEIDMLGIGEANRLAIRRALAQLPQRPTIALVDAFTVAGASCPTEGILHGDLQVRSIAAASVVAKVYRDNLMVGLHMNDPRYCFDLHKGYGTALHLECLHKFGASDFHRKSFAPVRSMLE